MLDANDARFGEFAVWQDANGDGVSDAGEVKTLAELGITSINLTSSGKTDASQAGMLVHGTTTAQTANDVVDLSSLFADGHAEGQWQQGGQVTQNGHTFNVYQYSGDQTLQVLIDQHIVQSNVHLS